MVGLFVVAAGVMLVAVPPSLVLGRPAAYAGGRAGRHLTGPSSREAPIQMAAKRPSRGSPSEPTVTEPVVGADPRAANPSRRGDAAPRLGRARRPDGRGGRRRQDPRDDRRRGAQAPPRAAPPAGRERLGRPVRAVARAGRAGRGRPRAPPARRRGRPRGQPAGEDRDHRRHRPHRPVLSRLRRRARRRPSWTSSWARASCSRPTIRRGSRARRTTCAPASSRSCATGPDHLLWALADDVVDGYFPFADRLGDAIDEIQDEVVREREARDARARSSS